MSSRAGSNWSRDRERAGRWPSAVDARDTRRAADRAMPATINGARRMLRVHDVPLPTGGVAGFAVDIEELEQARGGHEALRRCAARDARPAIGGRRAVRRRPQRWPSATSRSSGMFAMKSEWLADRPEFDRVLERMREANRLPEVRDFPAGRPSGATGSWPRRARSRRSGTLPGGTHLRVVAQPLPDGGLLLIFEDRTEQVQLASARDTLLRVRTATFDNLFEALGVFAGDGRLQIWNNKFRACGASRRHSSATHPRIDALVEAAATELANPAERAAVIADLVRSATVDRRSARAASRSPTGGISSSPRVPLPDGNALFTMLDISDSRRVERALRDRNEALEAADRVKTAFVANMSYELRTPLTSINGFAEMLHGGYAGKLSEAGRVCRRRSWNRSSGSARWSTTCST